MNKKISQLKALTTVTGDEEFPLAYQGVTYKLPLSRIAQLVSVGGLGLDRIDNTSDMDKPVSTATAAALSTKADQSHTHVTTSITGLTEALNGRAPAVHYHAASDVTDFQQAVDARISVRLVRAEW